MRFRQGTESLSGTSVVVLTLLVVLLVAGEDRSDAEWVEPRASPSGMGGCLSATLVGHTPTMELSVDLMLLLLLAMVENRSESELVMMLLMVLLVELLLVLSIVI
jgi:hypothetical protein